MYDLIDQPAATLGNGRRLILWAMRGWVGAIACSVCPPVSLAPAFAKLGLIPALPDLHRAMALLHRDPKAQLALSAIEFPFIDEDEALLLGLWRDVAAAGGPGDIGPAGRSRGDRADPGGDDRRGHETGGSEAGTDRPADMPASGGLLACDDHISADLHQSDD